MDDRNWITDQVAAAARDAQPDYDWPREGPDWREAEQDERDMS